MIYIHPDKCDFCGTCVAVCPVDCIDLKEASIDIRNDICIDCDLCVQICPIDVLEGRYEKQI
ncbi:MAG: 4Fe-4S binding protein [Candidatus Marinimicrobia bacterium]|nr:4Fe-4S binding protein [Candidatus Neomarinimicrobiota bacterium]MBT3634653.1 4Fe-4S binding protein [Candidatus Neomarinimicrobiota bacterium]MBT3682717.1 4Fe-4S binding protein [Candidatus Neomarinimicrobiota bacterium]MBT3759628.1 4Fe-4S binding protein [Candidatus Neomarinimicrobiota bacterium]MBT3894500.1 4Fe-4S binding protein [Candidatus Neomarinimicrobiota bacterium]